MNVPKSNFYDMVHGYGTNKNHLFYCALLLNLIFNAVILKYTLIVYTFNNNTASNNLLHKYDKLLKSPMGRGKINTINLMSYI